MKPGATSFLFHSIFFHFGLSRYLGCHIGWRLDPIHSPMIQTNWMLVSECLRGDSLCGHQTLLGNLSLLFSEFCITDLVVTWIDWTEDGVFRWFFFYFIFFLFSVHVHTAPIRRRNVNRILVNWVGNMNLDLVWRKMTVARNGMDTCDHQLMKVNF